jgi:hypothetical protein
VNSFVHFEASFREPYFIAAAGSVDGCLQGRLNVFVYPRVIHIHHLPVIAIPVSGCQRLSGQRGMCFFFGALEKE